MCVYIIMCVYVVCCSVSSPQVSPRHHYGMCIYRTWHAVHVCMCIYMLGVLCCLALMFV